MAEPIVPRTSLQKQCVSIINDMINLMLDLEAQLFSLFHNTPTLQHTADDNIVKNTNLDSAKYSQTTDGGL